MLHYYGLCGKTDSYVAILIIVLHFSKCVTAGMSIVFLPSAIVGLAFLPGIGFVKILRISRSILIFCYILIMVNGWDIFSGNLSPPNTPFNYQKIFGFSDDSSIRN